MYQGFKVADNIHFIECPFSRPGYFTGVCAILGETVTLIDSGLTTSPEESIFPYLRSLGRKESETSMVVLTHGHGDHCDGASTMKRICKLKVAVHKMDENLVKDPTLHYRNLHSRFPDFFPPDSKPDHEPLEVDVTLDDEERINIEGHELRVVHTPGHTAGCIALLDEELKLCVSGDSIQGRGEGRPLIFYDSLEYERSMRRLVDEEIDVLILGHPMPPLNKGVLHGEEVKIHLRESLHAIQELRDNVLKILKASDEYLSLKDLSVKMPEARPSSIGCILESLERSGEVELMKTHKSLLWRVVKAK
ncbi:MAG: MBL fold metallo-hydrolase [Candidatus Bathyarchaeia archaeon]